MTIAPSARPRVLLADDHSAFLESVSHFLGAAFDVVALASDGRQALDLARRLQPDVVVLDITMPGLDGFQTLARLRQEGPQPKVVFMTMHGDDEFVSTAINAGADGYVLKSRVRLDLIDAIDHALAGRLFVPSLTSLSAVAGSRHTAHFHGNDRYVLDAVSRLVRSTLLAGEPVVIAASEATRIGVAQRLQGQMNLAIAAERGQYVEQDSALAVSQIMCDGRPDKERLREVIHGLDWLRLAAPHGPRSRLTVFGDMTVALCRSGDFAAALELEQMWNELTRSLPFLTICSYPIECFEPSTARHQLARVFAEHSAVAS